MLYLIYQLLFNKGLFFERYIVKSLGKHQKLPPFQATCEIFKSNTTYACIGEPVFQKKTANQKAAAKILETGATLYEIKNIKNSLQHSILSDLIYIYISIFFTTYKQNQSEICICNKTIMILIIHEKKKYICICF